MAIFVDTKAGIIRGITLIPPQQLKGLAANQACTLYESARVAIDGEQGVRNRIGVLRSVRQSEDGSGAIVADLHCVTGHALWQQVAEIATRWPEDLNFTTRVRNAGASIVIAGVGLSVQPTGGASEPTRPIAECVQLTESAPLAPVRTAKPKRWPVPPREELLAALGRKKGDASKLLRQLTGDGSRLARDVR